jgi:polysaccharide pyruvyl transferase WcaK-like protein
MDLDEFTEWTKTYGNVFFNIPSWMEHYRRFDFVVGLRIHGVMLALQAGVPALCIAHDSRTIELCETMKVPFVHAREVIHGIERKNLLKLFNFNPDEFDSNRNNILHSYIDFLKNNKLDFKKA